MGPGGSRRGSGAGGEGNNAASSGPAAAEEARLREFAALYEKRAEEHEAYVKARNDMQDAINAVDGAIKVRFAKTSFWKICSSSRWCVFFVSQAL